MRCEPISICRSVPRTRGRNAFLFLLAALLAIGARTGSAIQGRKVENHMNGEVKLQCQISMPYENLIHIHYLLSNGSRSAIYVFTPLSDYRNNQFLPAPARVYAQMDNGGLLTLSRQLWKVPEAVSVYLPEVPFLTLVAPMSHIQEIISVPLPVIQNYPYLSAGNPEREKRREATEARTVSFLIGYMPDDPELRVTSVPTAPGLFAVAYGPGIMRQRLLSCGPIALTVPVLVH